MSKPLTTDDFYDVHNINYSQRSDGIIIVNQAYQTMDQFVDYKHFFDGILISIMTEGSINVNIHFQKYNIKKGDVILILPHLLVELLETSEDAHMITMGLSLDFLSNFPVLGNFITNNQVRWQPIIQLDHQSHLILEDLILLSQKVFIQNHSEKKTEVLHYLIFALLSLLSEKYSNLPNGSNLQKNRKLEIIDKFYMLVSQQAYKQQNVSFYAEKLHLTPQYLTTLLKSETGKSMIQWIDYFVITRAKFLLRSTNDPIKEISAELNFGDISLFCRYFKRNTGTTPKKFRMHYAGVIN
ncbi:helix-turn-helix domain-containing protein [Chryseobacterium sp. c4a]|uniref:helix-turn-helix domain-containing protein n=1 Tax=Chryseobacterium sp. c4a TaxID=1573582 RepID=UPI00135A9A8D|nr:AraC family transcriptional regulator [Chryseobacterium sp. c4a]